MTDLVEHAVFLQKFLAEDLNEEKAEDDGVDDEASDTKKSVINREDPGVSISVNLLYFFLSSVLALGATWMTNQMLDCDPSNNNQQITCNPELSSLPRNTKRWIRVVVIATVYILSSFWILFVRKVPSGAANLVGGIHALLMKRDYSWAFYFNWFEVSLASTVLIISHYNKTAGKRTLLRDAAIWALYASLFCLAIPALDFLGDDHKQSRVAFFVAVVVTFLLNWKTTGPDLEESLLSENLMANEAASAPLTKVERCRDVEQEEDEGDEDLQDDLMKT